MKNLFAIVFIFSFLSLSAQPVQEWCSSNTAAKPAVFSKGKKNPSLMADSEGNIVALTRSTDPSSNSFNIYKYSPSGELIWEYTYTASVDRPVNVEVFRIDSEDNIITSGEQITYVDSGYGYQYIYGDMFVQKLSKDGELLWLFTDEENIMNSPGRNSCNAIYFDEQNNLYISCQWDNLIDTYLRNHIFCLSPEGELLWNQTFDTAIGGAINGNENQIFSVGLLKGYNIETKITIQRHNLEGELIFSNELDNYSFERWENTPVLDENGNIYLPTEYGEFGLTKFDADGNFLWEFHKESFFPINDSPDRIYSLEIDHNGNIYLSGIFYNTNAQYQGIKHITLKLSPTGNIIWENEFANPSQDFQGEIHSMSFFDDNKILLLGGVYYNGPKRVFMHIIDENGETNRLDIFDQGNGGFRKAIGVTSEDIVYTLTEYESNNMRKYHLCKYNEVVNTSQIHTTNLNIFPNPAKDKITIQGILLESIDQVQLFNAQGQLLLSNPDITDGSLEIPSSIPNGIYFLNIKVENQILQQKIFLYK